MKKKGRNKMNLILLDDHELFAKSLEISLKNYVTSFKSYTQVESMKKSLERELPDILLLDIHMEEDNGLEIAKDLLKKHKNLKIVFLSGYDLVEYHHEAIKLGAWGFISKNISIDDLVDKLRLVLTDNIIFPEYKRQVEPLSNREKEILKLAAEGLTQQEIADTLEISRRTVGNHVQTIIEKLKVDSTVGAIVRGIQLGIVKISIG